MGTLLVEAKLPGFSIAISQRKGNPCSNPEYSKHFNVGFRRVTIGVSRENLWLPTKFFYVDLVSVKPSWNILIKNCTGSHLLVVEASDLIVDITQTCREYTEKVVDVIQLKLMSMVTREPRHIEISFQHTDFSNITIHG